MMKSAMRVVGVILGFIAVIVVAQWSLTRDERPEWRLVLRAEVTRGEGAAERWEFVISKQGQSFLGDEPSSPAGVAAKIKGATGRVTVEAWDETTGSGWRFVREGDGTTSLDGRPFTGEQLQRKLEEYISSLGVARSRPATVQDVLDAKIPCPTVTKVSLPGLSYREAYPGATDEPEAEIKEYHGHPMHEDASLMPKEMAEFFPEGRLPPVGERLPVNPAVIRGCDGVGKYSRAGEPMIWRRCGIDDRYLLYTKIGYPALVRFDPSGRLQANIAWKWEASADNRVFTFYLRKGMKWSDGKPYTTEDILFALNTVIGGAAAAVEPPDWMRATDGSNMIYADDVSDWGGLTRRICVEAEAEGASAGKQLWKVIEEDKTGRLKVLREMVEKAARGAAPEEDAQYEILGKLNSALTSPAYYDGEAWRRVDFDEELRGLRARGVSRLSQKEVERFQLLMLREDWLRHANDLTDGKIWKPGAVTQFNILMFREAYAEFVAPARRDRVKVEAVADATGDARYILRYTFKQPNSIFLETAATFMFYLWHYNTQKAHRGRYHPDGYDKLDIFDILKWRELLGGMRKASEAGGPSPGKHIWSLLGGEMKGKLAERLPAEARGKDEAYKREIVEELSRAMERRDFYDEASWGGVDLKGELGRLLRASYASLQARERRRVTEILRRENFLERGVGDLSQEELQRFNLMMFRAAYDGDPTLEEDRRDEVKLVAINREDALDKEAQFRGYRTWSLFYDELGAYDPEWNREVPTITPWRVVSEPDDPRVVAVRNPYYFKVDTEGNQLPYIDMVDSDLTERPEIRLLKMQSGQVDFFERETQWSDYTALKLLAKPEDYAKGYQVRLWANDYCGELIFISGQAHADPEYRRLQSDPRFRQAMSLALDRQEMIDIVWQGMGKPAQWSVPEGSPYYNARWNKAYTEYDPARANRLLDELGLVNRGPDGMRLLWSGQPLTLEVSTEAERPLAAVQLACNYWQAVGINALMKVRRGDIKWRLYEMGKYDVWVHKEGGNYFGPLLVGYITPTHEAESVQYSRWALWLRSGGRQGEEPPDRVKELGRMFDKVVTSPNEEAKLAAWKRLTDRAAEELPVFAVTTSPGKVIYLRNNFRNVPKLALAGWIAHDPGNCNPEVFYIDQGQ